MAEPAPPDTDDQTTEVREAHRVDVPSLRGYLASRLEGLGADLAVRQFQGGQSNPTFLISSGDRRWVLRKKPPGVLLPSAHQIEREYRILSVLAATDAPVPRVHLLCEDAAVIGTPFYVMEHVVGRVFRSPLAPGVDPPERKAIFLAMAGTLARLHRLDFVALGLSDFGKVGGYVARQVSRWTKQYEASRTEDVPSMRELSTWLVANLPPGDETTIAHGDYRLENLVLHPTEPRVVAILDWELATLGHPLADLGYNCMPYHVPSASQGRSLIGADLTGLGIPSQEEYVAEYCRSAGRESVPDLGYYLAFAMFRSAAIIQGVYKRGLDGNASSETALSLGVLVRSIADGAWALVSRGG